MKNLFVILTLLLIHCLCYSQSLNNSSTKLKKAREKLSLPIQQFFSECLLDENCDSCISQLLSYETNEFSSHILASALYNIAPEKSFQLHKKAYQTKSNELNFNLEFAIELHRTENYREAIPLYLAYKKEVPSDYRIDVWLSECYINIGEKDKAISHWKMANHPRQHTGIDKAIHIIHGRTDQIRMRSRLREAIKTADSISAYKLIYMDLNWEHDWWNTIIQRYFLESDLDLIKSVFGEEHKLFNIVKSYSEIKLASSSYRTDSIKTLYDNSELILNNTLLPPDGGVSSDLIRIALLNGLTSSKDLLENRGKEILNLAETLQDSDFLNIYAYLQSEAKGTVPARTDLKGWKEFNDHRFAISYFIGLGEEIDYSNPDLTQAIIDFPQSAKLQEIKLRYTISQNRPYEEDLILLIQKEFKSLGSDVNNYSYMLKSYFYMLEHGIRIN